MLVKDSAAQRVHGDLKKWFMAVLIPLGNATQV
jgi:hypothetical protein